MNNKITVVTPSLNQAGFLEQAIESVLSQSGDFYIDYIITDGGSTDESVKIIKRYDQLIKDDKYPIKCRGIELNWWSKPDRGQTNALNKGFKTGSGDICAWINSDDWYESGAFQIIADKFRKHSEMDLIYGNVSEIFHTTGEKRKGEGNQSDFQKNLKEGCQISQQGAFFKKRSLERAGYLDESFNYCMDYDLWMKILRDGKALFINHDLANFRYWSDSKTCSAQDKFREEENIIRKKYGGSVINPGAIHRFRYKIPGINMVKKHCPWVYKFAKNIIYKFINLFKHK